MPIGLALGLLASVTWGVVDVTAVLSTRRVGSLRVLVVAQLVTLAVLLAMAILAPSLLGPSAAAGLLAGVPIGVLASGVYLAYFTALRLGPVSIVSPVIVAYGGLTVVLAVAFRGETLTPAQAAGAVVATAGVALAGITFEAGSLRGARLVGPGLVAAVLTMFGFALVTVLLAGPIGEHGWLSVAIGSRVGNSATSLLLLVVALRAGSSRFTPLLIPWRGWSRAVVALMVATGAFDVAGYIAFAIGLAVAPVWLVGLASSFGPVLAVAYAIALLGERPRRTQWLGLVGIALGVVVLALAG